MTRDFIHNVGPPGPDFVLVDQAYLLDDLKKTKLIQLGKNVQICGDVYIIPKPPIEDEIVPVIIGDDCILQQGAILYAGVTLQDKVRVCHNSVIRENTFIGTHSIIGNLVMIEGNAVIGDHSIINSQSHVTAYTKIHPYAFLGASVTMTNDKYINWYRKGHGRGLKGPIIGKWARIGSGAGIMGGIKLGYESLIGAGAVVTKDVGPCEVWFGVPAKFIRKLDYEELIDKRQWCESCEISYNETLKTS